MTEDEELIVLDGFVQGLAWVDDQHVVVGRDIDLDRPNGLALLDVTTGEVEDVELEMRAPCDVGYPFRLDADRVLGVVSCPIADLGLAVINPADGTVDPLPLSDEVRPYLGFRPAPFAEDADVLAVESNSSLCAYVRVWVGGQLEPDLRVSIDDEEVPFSAASADSDCSETPRIGSPGVAPDGSTVAVFVAGPSGGDMQGLEDDRWSLQLVDVASGAPVEIFAGVGSPRSTRFTADGTRLGFLGDVEGQRGLYEVRLDDGETRLLADGGDWFDWSPDGSAVVIADEIVGEDRTAIRVVQLDRDGGRTA